jgi:hypothetical protein
MKGPIFSEANKAMNLRTSKVVMCMYNDRSSIMMRIVTQLYLILIVTSILKGRT